MTTPLVLIPGVMGSRLDFGKSMPEKRGFTINRDMDHQPIAKQWLFTAIENQIYMLDPGGPWPR